MRCIVCPLVPSVLGMHGREGSATTCETSPCDDSDAAAAALNPLTTTRLTCGSRRSITPPSAATAAPNRADSGPFNWTTCRSPPVLAADLERRGESGARVTLLGDVVTSLAQAPPASSDATANARARAMSIKRMRGPCGRAAEDGKAAGTPTGALPHQDRGRLSMERLYQRTQMPSTCGVAATGCAKRFRRWGVRI